MKADHGEGRARPSRQPEQTPQLSCELCRERKVKCDKLTPCTACTKSGTVCVPIHRKRLPRGRHARPHAPPCEDLKKRIHRLESLIGDLGSGRESLRHRERSSASPDPGNSAQSRSRQPSPPVFDGSSPQTSDISAESRSKGQPFWEDLVQEINGLRVAVEGPDDDDSQSGPSGAQDTTDSAGWMMGMGSSAHRAHQELSSRLTASRNDPTTLLRLCQIYLDQVDCIVKILHRPSLQRFMAGEDYLGRPREHPAVQALNAAVCYLAVISMSEDQCQSVFGTTKIMVVGDYRRTCEAAFEAAGLLMTDDIVVLQAFVLYLNARRSEDQGRGRSVWTMISIAVRLAQGLGLDNDDRNEAESFFNREMRRRLWYAISTLDIQASWEQSSEPTIPGAGPDIRMPKNLNDADFGPKTTTEIPETSELTDTTCSILVYESQRSGRNLHLVVQGDMPDAWEGRHRHVERFESDTAHLRRNINPDASNYAWFTFHTVESVRYLLRLGALRPLYRGPGGARSPGSPDMLQTALEVVRHNHAQQADPRGEGYRWYARLQWHALAFAITECYVCGDAALVQRAWPIVEASYWLHERSIAGYRGGILRNPLEKIMRLSRQRVSQLAGGSGTSRTSASSTRSASPSSEPWSDLGASGFGYPPPPGSESWTGLGGFDISQQISFTGLDLGFDGSDLQLTSVPMPQQPSDMFWYPPVASDGEGGLVNLPMVGSAAAWEPWSEYPSYLSYDGVTSSTVPASMYETAMDGFS